MTNFYKHNPFFLEEGNECHKRKQSLETSESLPSVNFREQYQSIDRQQLNNRRQKMDMSAGFSDLREARRDSLVREFIAKLKTKHESTIASSSIDKDKIEEEK